MNLIRQIILITIISFLPSLTFAQDSNKLTAEQIIQRAIDSSGGDRNLELFAGLETISQIITVKGDTLSFAVKKLNFEKYYVSTLSLGHVNSTTVFNQGKSALIENQYVQIEENKLKLEDLKLQSFVSIDYGYKKLGYKIERQKDEKFQNFDCFVILISSPLGKATLNFYDKKTGNLTMIIYPNGNKSIFIDFYKDKGIILPSKILMVDTSDQITFSTLTKVNFDNNLDLNWFHIPAIGKYEAPEIFKTGIYKYLNSNEGSKIIRDKNKQTEITGNSQQVYKIEWSSNNDYLIYRLKDASKAPTNDNIEFIKARITSWTNTKYYCQYLTSNNIGGTCAFEKLE